MIDLSQSFGGLRRKVRQMRSNYRKFAGILRVVQVPSPPLENHSGINFGKGLAAQSEIWMILAPVTGVFAEANGTAMGKIDL